MATAHQGCVRHMFCCVGGWWLPLKQKGTERRVRNVQMRNSEEFNREGDADPKKVVTKTAPLGLLPIMFIGVSILMIIAVAIWWASR